LSWVQVDASLKSDNGPETLNGSYYSSDEVKNALSVLVSVGVDTERLCHRGSEEYDSVIPPCIDATPVNGRVLHEHGEEGTTKNTMFYVRNSCMALLCVLSAALAAGLTMGLLSLEVLDLKIKEMASSSEEEKKHARILIPLLQDHHRLLVTLLLLNACANEALPIFLDSLVPSYVAVMLSVTLVLFFGEIIPTAIFAGPRKLAIASALSFVVRFLLFILAPLAIPIARLLDIFLHEHDDDGADTKYNRGEISALVKIQHEDRMRAKADRRQKMKMIEATLSESKKDVKIGYTGSDILNAHRYSIHLDEVTMVEGALAMQIKTAQDVMTPLGKAYAIPEDSILDKTTMVDIYRKGFSRVPIFAKSKNDTEVDSLDEKAAIIGLLLTKDLIVVDANENLPLSKIVCQKPYCVEPTTHMVDLVNLFQTGGDKAKGGHMALVCMNPEIANEFLDNDKPIPVDAGVIGVVTLEDCVEELIQEEIYDEYDKAEKKNNEIAHKALSKLETSMLRQNWHNQSVEAIANETTNLVEKTDAMLV